MIFSSNIFLLSFLPIFLGFYYVTSQKWRSFVIVASSYVFYGWWRVDFLLLLFSVTVWTYLVGLKIVSYKAPKQRKLVMLAGVIVNLLVLAYFKYFNFFYDSLVSMLSSSSASDADMWHVILPIGVSFYIFQAISYLVDVGRGDALPAKRFVDFAAFIALFPQLIAGPVLRYKEMAEQINSRVHSLSRFSEGARIFMIGFCKKVLIADSIAPIVDTTFALSSPTVIEAWMGAIAFTVQLYFDFSGYSDMAIGLGLMIGFRFPQNFDIPYASRSITEFWRRWHISLSIWLRDYLYIPLGGNRYGAINVSRNLLFTMLLGGLWHGANWTFVLWGALHGSVLIFERFWNIKNSVPCLAVLAWPITMLVVIVGWVMFRADSVNMAFGFYLGMLGRNGLALTDSVAWQVQSFSLAALLIGIAVCLLEVLQHSRNSFGMTRKRRYMLSKQIAGYSSVVLVCLMLMAILKLSASSYSPFLYFQF